MPRPVTATHLAPEDVVQRDTAAQLRRLDRQTANSTAPTITTTMIASTVRLRLDTVGLGAGAGVCESTGDGHARTQVNMAAATWSGIRFGRRDRCRQVRVALRNETLQTRKTRKGRDLKF
jgi:hypothetical protein